MVTMDFFAASNSYDFFNQYCSNLLKNPTVRGLICFLKSLPCTNEELQGAMDVNILSWK